MIQSDTFLEATDGTPLFLQTWLPDMAQHQGTVCVVHGLGEHSGRYEAWAQTLTEHGYAVLAMDLRGHGRSKGKRGHAPCIDCLLDDMERLLMHAYRTYTDRAVFLFGHSLGGALVLAYGLKRPPLLAGIIASAPWIRLAMPVPEGKIKLAAKLRKFWPSLTLGNGLDRNALSRDPEVVAAYRADRRVHDRISAQLGLDVHELGEWLLLNACNFSVPLLLMHGTADAITSHEASAEFARCSGIEVCDLVLLPGLFHEIHNEPEKQRVMGCLIDWLDDNR